MVLVLETTVQQKEKKEIGEQLLFKVFPALAIEQAYYAKTTTPVNTCYEEYE